MGRRLAEESTHALGEQSVVVVGTLAAATVLQRLAGQLAALRRQRSDFAVEVEKLVEAHFFPLPRRACPESASGPQPGSSPKSPASTSKPPATSPLNPVRLPAGHDADQPWRHPRGQVMTYITAIPRRRKMSKGTLRNRTILHALLMLGAVTRTFLVP